METAHDILEQAKNSLIGNIFPKYFQKNLMINTGKKLLYVTFENPAGSGVVLTDLKGKLPETVNSLVHAFVITAGERVGDERFVEKWVKNAVNSMVEEAVTNRGFVDMTAFGVGDEEAVVGRVVVSTVGEVGMEC